MSTSYDPTEQPATRLVKLEELTRGMTPTPASEACAPGNRAVEIAYVDWRATSVGVTFMDGSSRDVDRAIKIVRIYA